MQEEEKRFHHHAGLYVKDLGADKVLFEYNSRQYFTPASNTKILTFFTALNLLGDRVPALRYEERNDSLIFWGTGDPSFLYDLTFNDSTVFEFLKSARKSLYFSAANFHTTNFGPGWAWDDYNDEYSAERSPMPIYGNCFQVLPLPDGLLVVPMFFGRYLQHGLPGEKAEVVRDVTSNTFSFRPGRDGKFREFRIPFRTNQALVAQILSDTLHKAVRLSTSRPSKSASTIYGVPSDSLYSVMMKESDNHIAEQLLLMSACVISDTLMPEIAIRHMQQNFFKTYSDKPIWRDGSGLSRYNLVTPRFIGELWQDI